MEQAKKKVGSVEKMNAEVPPKGDEDEDGMVIAQVLAGLRETGTVAGGAAVVEGADKKKKEKLERPHICKTCGKSFSRADSLSVHMRAHSGCSPHRVQSVKQSFTCTVVGASAIFHRIGRCALRQRAPHSPFPCWLSRDPRTGYVVADGPAGLQGSAHTSAGHAARYQDPSPPPPSPSLPRILISSP